MKKKIMLSIMSFVFLFGCTKEETDSSSQPPQALFDNSIHGLWIVTKTTGDVNFTVDDSFLVRKDKYNSGFGTRTTFTSTTNRITIKDDVSASQTDFDITKYHSGEFLLTSVKGSFVIQKLKDAPNCPTITSITKVVNRVYEITGDILFITDAFFKAPASFYLGNSLLTFPTFSPGTMIPSTLKENDTLIYQPDYMGCTPTFFLYNKGEWIKK